MSTPSPAREGITGRQATTATGSGKHTPPPWFATGRTAYALNKSGVNRFWTHIQEGHTDNGDRTPDSEVEANAELIARAPEMQTRIAELEAALAELLSSQDVMNSRSDYLPGERSRRLSAAKEAARAALAKKV